MSKSVQAIVGMGMVCGMFMIIMSMVYLQHLPSQADLDRLETDLRGEFDMVLSTTARLKLTLIKPSEDESRFGVAIDCMMRADIRRRPSSIKLYLDRIGASVLLHPDWKGKVSQVIVRHGPRPQIERIARPDAKAAEPVKPAGDPAKKPAKKPVKTPAKKAATPPNKRAAAGGSK